MRLKAFPLLFILICSSLPGISQLKLGLVNSNFAGTSALQVNPALMTTSRLYLDFHLVSMNTFFQNNYHYIHGEDYKPLTFLMGGPYPEYGRFDAFTDIYRDPEDKNGSLTLRIDGPAAMMAYGKHAFGVSTAFRNVFSFRNLPIDMANFLYETIDYKPQFNIRYTHNDEEINVGQLSWFELGLSYAYIFKRHRWEYWSAGITVKPLFGYAGYYANGYNVDYQVFNDSVADIYTAVFEYAHSAPVDYATNAYPDGSGLFKGYGIGMDAGVVYQKTTEGHGRYTFSRLCQQPYEPYRYRIGFSILDLGIIKFNKKAEVHTFNNTDTTFWRENTDTLPNSTLDEIEYKLNHYFKEQQGQSLEAREFAMQLPLTFGLLGDVNLYSNYYLNGTLIYGVNFGKSYIRRPTIFSLTPRFENALFEISLPVSMYNWEWTNPRIGMAVRSGNILMGTDKLGSFFKFSDFTGMDFYFSIRLNLSKALNLFYVKGYCGDVNYNDIRSFDFWNF